MAKARSGAEGEFYRHVGGQVRLLREAAALKQDELALRVGISRASVANVEAGKQAVPLHILIAITETLGASVGELIPKRDSPRPPGTTLADAPLGVRAFIKELSAS
jgi:transcriptional regulator with XRE-family HTH domain